MTARTASSRRARRSGAPDPHTPDDLAVLADRVRRAGADAGLVALGITDAAPFPQARGALERRRGAGQHGGMGFTYRRPDRSTDPTFVLPSARTLVVGAWSYASPEPAEPDDGRAHGRVARYARADHYAALRAALEAPAGLLRDEGYRAVVVADQNHLVDRAAAHRAGVGWWGRNTNLLLPGLGPWFVLGTVVTNAVLPGGAEPLADGCRTCTRCVPACPTGALSPDGTLDARRCLAWLVQTDGIVPRAYRAALGDRLYGCDDCIEACPPGRRAHEHSPPTGETIAATGTAHVDLVELLDATDDELLARFGAWYVPHRDPAYLRRNALVVLGNVGDRDDPEHARVVIEALAHPAPLVRAHAVWAAARLGRLDLLASVADDPDPVVRAELALAPAVTTNATPAPAPTVPPASVPVRLRP